MKKFALILASVLWCTVSAEEQKEIRITHGPWLCDMDSHGVTIMWVTNRPALSWVEVAPDDGQHFYSNAHPRHYDAAHGRRRALETLHRVRVEGLEPGTDYMYRIFSQATDGWAYSDAVDCGTSGSAPGERRGAVSCTTWDPVGVRIKFLGVDDSAGNWDVVRKLGSEVNCAEYEFVVLNGNMLTTTENEAQIFDGWLDACVDLFASEVPVVFVRGNHENRGAYADRLFDYFPHRSGHFYHTFCTAGTEFVVLDCGEDKPDTDIEYGGIAEFDPYREEEARWLAGALNPAMRQRIVFLHIPLATLFWHGDLHLQETLLPILNDAEVDLMLSGHTHRYAFREADDRVKFPIVINDNRSCMSVTVERGTIRIEIFGNVKKKHTFNTAE